MTRLKPRFRVLAPVNTQITSTQIRVDIDAMGVIRITETILRGSGSFRLESYSGVASTVTLGSMCQCAKVTTRAVMVSLSDG